MSNNKLEVTGHLLEIGNKFESTTSTFKKISFRLAIREDAGTSSWLETPEFILVNDKISLLDSVRPGDKLTVKFSLAGHEFKGKDKTMHFTELKAYDVAKEVADAPAKTPAKDGKIDAVISDTRLLDPPEDDNSELPF